MKNQKGFSLVELLVVVIIIAIIAAIAIPNLLASRRASNEASAVSTLRTYHSAQVTYFATAGLGQDYGTPAELGTAGLVDQAIDQSPTTKSGYVFTTGQADVVAGPPLVPSTYCTEASPQSTGLTGTGTYYYGVSTDGVIYKHTAQLSCTAAGVLTVAGNPIQ